MHRTVIAPLAGAVLLLGACSDSSTAPPDSGGPSISTSPSVAGVDATIQGTEFSFLLPETLPSGEVTLAYENIGGQPHFYELAKIDEGVTDAQIEEALQAKGEPEFLQGEGPGFGLLSPGTSAVATADLEPGNYVFLCFLPDVDGTPHALKGMYQQVTVGDEGSTVAPPEPDVTVEVGKDGWTTPDLGDVAPGDVTFEIVGSPDTKGHSFEIARIDDDAITTVKEGDQAVTEWFRSGYEGVPPVTLVGGLFAVKPGETRVLTVTLEAGRYGLIDQAGAGEIVEIG